MANEYTRKSRLPRQVGTPSDEIRSLITHAAEPARGTPAATPMWIRPVFPQFSGETAPSLRDPKSDIKKLIPAGTRDRTTPTINPG